MSETADYIEETEDYTVRGGEVPEDGDDIAGEEGELVIEIIQANYPAGKTATAQDADLTAANVKSGSQYFRSCRRTCTPSPATTWQEGKERF